MGIRTYLPGVLLGVAGAVAAQGAAVPVYIGDVREFAACVSWGEVIGATSLTVRGGPGTKFPALGQLPSGQQVNLCDVSGDWLGVVYAPGGSLSDCGVSAPVAERQPYVGTCRSGWVHRKFIQVAPQRL